MFIFVVFDLAKYFFLNGMGGEKPHLLFIEL